MSPRQLRETERPAVAVQARRNATAPAPESAPAQANGRTPTAIGGGGNDALGATLARAVEQRAITDPTLQRWPAWMKWMKKKFTPGHAAGAVVPLPVYVPPPSGKVQFRDTGVYAFPSAFYTPPDGDDRSYTEIVIDHLEDIRGYMGDGFFTSLATNGKQQGIKYEGPGGNQCAGVPMGYTKLRKRHDGGSTVKFGAELTTTIADMGIDAGQLVTRLRAQGLPRWSNTVDPAPIDEFDDAQETADKVDDWLAGRELPSIDEMDVLMLVVASHAEHGPGVHARIGYDPLSMTTSHGPRPPQVGLFHELVHALYYTHGAQLGREDSSEEEAGGRLFELMSVGLPPFHTAPYSENALRAAWAPAVAPRPSYP